MGSNYQVMGVGSYKVGSGYVYSTQNFGSKSCQGTVPNTPIHHGSHTFNVTGSSVIYIVSYYSTTAATSAKIYIDGTGFDLTRLYGTATQGFYVYKPSTYTACQNYAFEFKTATATFKFPETGSLTTATKSNACTASWTSTNVFSGTSTTSSTGSPTSTSATSSSSTSTSATSSSPTSTSATSSSPTSTSATSSSSSSSTSTPSPTPNPSSSSSSSSSSSTGTGGSSTGGPVDEPNNATKTFSNIYLVLIFSIFGLIVF
ncbi:hypothetical protein CYY_005591 [Polysphondylium violaceum]|nr:hypothetical protein CYY_005591 [Polysphondylium violaceum]